jgi:hypothetical protein
MSKLKLFVAAGLLLCSFSTIGYSQDNPAAFDREVYAARGAILTDQDSLSVALRDIQQNQEAKNGFHIGMAVAEGQTAPGPGKDAKCARLVVWERSGCTIAVLFSVERNRNATLASRGAAMVAEDPAFAQERAAVTSSRRRASDIIFYNLGFNIGLGASDEQTFPGPGKDKIRDALLHPVEQLGFNQAVSFALNRNRIAAGLESLPGTIDREERAARGAILTGEDPLAIQLRDSQPDEASRKAFHIGMASAEKHTALGPGKDAACASLGLVKVACTMAVQFSVERNRNIVLASRGAEIVSSDPVAAQARSATTLRYRSPLDSAFYRLGFNIGLAASEGQTLPGPGKDKIRDSLPYPAMQLGFSDAVTFNLARNKAAGL